MYDQEHYYRIYFFQWWINREQYEDSLKISGYAPEGWILYTQAEQNPFFFGAYPEESLKKEGEIEFSNLKNKKYVQKLRNTYSKMFDMSKEIKEEYFHEFYGNEKEIILKNPEKVIDFFKKLKKTAGFFCSHYLLTQPQRFFKVEEEIKKLNDSEIFSLIEHGDELTNLTKFRKILLMIAKEIKGSGLGVEEFLKKFPEKKRKLIENVHEFGFLTWDIFGGKLTTNENIAEILGEIINNSEDLNSELENINKIELKIQKRKSIELKTELHQIAEIVGDLLVYRFDTNTYVLCLANYFVQFTNAIQKIYKISEIDLQSYKLEEIFELLKTGKKVDNKILEKRKKGYLQIHYHDKFEEYEGNEAREKIKDLLEFRKKTHKQTKTLTGNVACFPEKDVKFIQGRAFVIDSNYDADEKFKSFRERDVLVTTQTHPTLVFLMKKAKAIITDEGGLTCHAAIISRELGIPCIIGTKIATKVLKTGDEIEIDVEKGVIRIIK